MAEDDRWQPGPHDLRVPFIFVPHGAPDPVEWKAAHPEWVKFPATFVPRQPAPPFEPAQSETDVPQRDEAAHPPDALVPPALPSAAPEPDGAAVSMAAMIDPVGTLRGLGYDLTGGVSGDGTGSVLVPIRYIPDERADPPRPNADMQLSATGKAFLYRQEVEPGSAHTHWPGEGSGVTIGAGYDMRDRSRNEVLRDLESVGVNPETAGVLSAGVGLTGLAAQDFADVHAGDVSLTEEQQEALMELAMKPAIRVVQDWVFVPLNANEFAALVSLGYNIGDSGLRNSVVLTLVNEGDRRDAANEFLTVNKSKGRYMRSLADRRARERLLFLTPQEHPDGPHQ